MSPRMPAQLQQQNVRGPGLKCGEALTMGLIAAILAITLVSNASAQQVPTAPSLKLAPGVIVDPDRGFAYVMSTEGGIDAVELARGTRVWHSNAAAKPLVLAGDLLVCQGDARSGNNALEIVIVNVRQRGESVLARTVPLASGVQVSIDAMLTGTFTSSALVVGREVVVSWAYAAHPERARGMPDTTPRDDKSRQAPAAPPARGSFRMDLSSGEVTPLPPEQAPAVVPAPSNLGPRARLPNVPDLQFLSADSLHVLGVQRIAADPAWERFRWSIHQRVSGAKVGEFGAHWSWAPFVVLGAQIIYLTPPYMRRTDQKLAEEPNKFRAADLATGRELWAWPVRDTAYRGLIPP